MQRAGVLAAVHFDDQRCFETNKISDEAIDWNLATKLEASESAITQGEPQFALGVGHAGAQRTGPLTHRSGDADVSLSPCGRGRPRAQRVAG